jgi:glycosyltransferase involved in cell wall biosynthesis
MKCNFDKNNKPYPCVSVCIPTYNGGKYIRECIESILAQTYTDFEILIVDDKSSDETIDIAEEFARRDKRIRIVINQLNLGLVKNWNRCVELAGGEWIKFVFQDDIIAPDCIEELLNCCNGGSLFAVCRRIIIFEEGSEFLSKYYEYIENINIENIFNGKTFITPEIFRSACLKYLSLNFIGEPTAVIIHKSIFQKLGTFNPNLIHLCDWEFWLRVGINHGFTYMPKNLATFRVHSDGTSSKNIKKKILQMDLLDNIVMLHEFSFNPLYKPLRDTAFRNIPQINFRDLLIYNVHEIVTLIESRLRDDARENKDIYVDWQKITRNFPVLLELPVKGYSRIIHAINRRLRRFYYNNYYNKQFIKIYQKTDIK